MLQHQGQQQLRSTELNRNSRTNKYVNNVINGYKRKRATTATASLNSRVEELEQHKVPSAQDVIVEYCWLIKFQESTSSRVLGLRSWLDAWSFLLPHQTGTIVDVLIQSYWFGMIRSCLISWSRPSFHFCTLMTLMYLMSHVFTQDFTRCHNMWQDFTPFFASPCKVERQNVKHSRTFLSMMS